MMSAAKRRASKGEAILESGALFGQVMVLEFRSNKVPIDIFSNKNNYPWQTTCILNMIDRYLSPNSQIVEENSTQNTYHFNM